MREGRYIRTKETKGQIIKKSLAAAFCPLLSPKVDKSDALGLVQSVQAGVQ